MRLLRPEANGEFSLVEFLGKTIPRYAILSHTWGTDDEEVTLKDLVDGAGKSKSGYSKISFCGKQAAKDGLQFFWVDTCCIDKSSSAELSEAINSMFRWYHNATKCYVYLSDVSGSVANGPPSQQILKPAIQHSRWFTRSWTLQELIAPTSVEFFSAEGKRLGDRGTLLQEVHNTTGISIEALQGTPLSQFSVHKRMSWAARREAKREEDAAYSLLGIFDIHMPLIYGEGRKKAFVRLHKEIEQSLRDEPPTLHSSTVPFDSDLDFVRCIDVSHCSCGRCTAPAAHTAIRDSATGQPTRSMEEAQINKQTSPSFSSYDNSRQFNNPGGTQNNNTSSGNQFLGSFNGPVYFGQFSATCV